MTIPMTAIILGTGLVIYSDYPKVIIRIIVVTYISLITFYKLTISDVNFLTCVFTRSPAQPYLSIYGFVDQCCL